MLAEGAVSFEPIHYLALLERKPGGFDYAEPLENWQLPECFALLRRRLEAADPRHGTRSFIRVLRLLERFSLPQLTEAVEYALDIDVIDADSIRTILEHRAERPVELFSLDGRPHWPQVRVETTDVAAYRSPARRRWRHEQDRDQEHGAAQAPSQGS